MLLPELLCHEDGRLFPCVWDPLRHRLCCGKRRIIGGEQGCAGFSTMLGVIRVLLPWMGGQGCGCISSWRDRVPGPTATASQLPVAMGAPTVGRPKSCVLVLLLLLGFLKLWAHPSRSWG